MLFLLTSCSSEGSNGADVFVTSRCTARTISSLMRGERVCIHTHITTDSGKSILCDGLLSVNVMSEFSGINMYVSHSVQERIASLNLDERGLRVQSIAAYRDAMIRAEIALDGSVVENAELQLAGEPIRITIDGNSTTCPPEMSVSDVLLFISDKSSGSFYSVPLSEMDRDDLLHVSNTGFGLGWSDISGP